MSGSRLSWAAPGPDRSAASARVSEAAARVGRIKCLRIGDRGGGAAPRGERPVNPPGTGKTRRGHPCSTMPRPASFRSIQLPEIVLYPDRKSVVLGKTVLVRVDLGCSRLIIKKI